MHIYIYSVQLTQQVYIHKSHGGVGVRQTTSHRLVAASSFQQKRPYSSDYRIQGVQIIDILLQIGTIWIIKYFGLERVQTIDALS